MHLNLDDTVTAAGFASSAFHVEAETALAVSLRLGIRCGSKQVTDHIEHTGVGSRIGTRGTPDRRLVNVDDLI